MAKSIMDFLKSFVKVGDMSKIELLLLASFVVYLVFPIGTPTWASHFIISPIGYLTIFIVTVFLFFYTHPVLAILYIFVAYELLNRSNKALEKGKRHGSRPRHVQINDVPEYSDDEPTYAEYEYENENEDVSSPSFFESITNDSDTLEEEMVNTMAPIGVSQRTNYITTGFKPVMDNHGEAANYM